MIILIYHHFMIDSIIIFSTKQSLKIVNERKIQILCFRFLIVMLFYSNKFKLAIILTHSWQW